MDQASAIDAGIPCDSVEGFLSHLAVDAYYGERIRALALSDILHLSDVHVMVSEDGADPSDDSWLIVILNEQHGAGRVDFHSVPHAMNNLGRSIWQYCSPCIQLIAIYLNLHSDRSCEILLVGYDLFRDYIWEGREKKAALADLGLSGSEVDCAIFDFLSGGKTRSIYRAAGARLDDGNVDRGVAFLHARWQQTLGR